MAQKINPTSFRLGTNQIWSSSLQIYGKSFNFYFLNLHKLLQIKYFLRRFLYLNNFLLIQEKVKFNKNKIYLNIYYSYLPEGEKPKNHFFIQYLDRVITQWFKHHVYLHFYFKFQKTPTLNLLVMYSQILLSRNFSSNKIILNLCKLLENQIGFYKFSYFKNGFKKMYLAGFKIRLAGRFDNSKTQMAKSVKYTTGLLPLTHLNSYVEFKKKDVFTKSGICGLQIWLFYHLN